MTLTWREYNGALRADHLGFQYVIDEEYPEDRSSKVVLYIDFDSRAPKCGHEFREEDFASLNEAKEMAEDHATATTMEKDL